MSLGRFIYRAGRLAQCGETSISPVQLAGEWDAAQDGRMANQTVQRTGASRFAQRQIEHHRRLAPVADLCVSPQSVPRTQLC
jgi:hypothetical protein